jgi:hypothetical protein
MLCLAAALFRLAAPYFGIQFYRNGSTYMQYCSILADGNNAFHHHFLGTACTYMS